MERDGGAVASSEGQEFAEWLRSALEALYDNASLATNPLCDRYPEIAALPDPVSRAQAMRSLLLDGIESLRPLQQVQAYAQAMRDYEVLSLRYASGLSMDQIAEQLCVGVRQVYRDLHRAEDKLVEVLRTMRHQGGLSEAEDQRQAAMQREVDSLQRSQQTLDAREAVAAAVSAVRPLADGRAIVLNYEAPPMPALARGTPGVLRTGITQLLSAVVQAAASGSTVELVLTCQGAEPSVSISYLPGGLEPHLGAAISAARTAGLVPQLRQMADGRLQMQVGLPAPLRKRILVIEDNASAVELYERYMEGTGWQVSCLPDPTKAAEVARRTRPNAIVLDIMMPELDGWTVMQALRLDPDTSSIPVIICSVVHDPGLAAALGASACLAKPVTRLELIGALRRVLGG